MLALEEPPIIPEKGAWEGIAGQWRQLHGSFPRLGVSVEYHHFRAGPDLDWSRSFHEDSLEICLNLQGSATLATPASECRMGVRSVALYAPAAGGLQARRPGSQYHHFVTVEMGRAFLSAQLGGAVDAVHPEVRGYLDGARPVFARVAPMTLSLQEVTRTMADPPVPAPARALWYDAKVTELLSVLLFPETPAEMFCSRQKRLSRERVEHARTILRRDLENPPSLEMLAAETGCGAFHLSRSFSQLTGTTIPQYLRRLRLERAAQLLREGRCNVTEAALAVGYSSLSHFSKAFWEMFGCCPGLYANPKLAAAVARPKPRKG